MKLIYILTISLVILTACEKTIELDLEQVPPKVVIEGLVTNNPAFQYIKITRTNGFYITGEAPRVTNANVTVEDDLGNKFLFIHNPNNNPDSAGYYIPVPAFSGEIGRTYALRVNLEGNTYEAQDRLSDVLKIDSLTYEIDPREFRDPEDPGKFYVVKLFAKEPPATVDFYLFNFFRNDTLALDNDTDIYFTDDRILNENIDGIEAPLHFSEQDTVTVHTFSISRQGYVFYSDLVTLLNSDGGMFSPPPANCRNNLSNGALGFFQVGAVSVNTVIIDK